MEEIIRFDSTESVRNTHVECVSFPLELRGGVDLVSHDASNGLLHVLHPLGHLHVPHVVHLLDELVVLLPESHLVCDSCLCLCLLCKRIDKSK